MKDRKIVNYTEFQEIISDIISNSEVQKMNNFQHHNQTTCYWHCMNVAYMNYCICKKLGLDFVSAARAGMIHDLFLYDWKTIDPKYRRNHAFTHPKLALANANKLFELNNKEQDIILKHMWPSTIIPPKYLESLIITFTDKYCAFKETFNFSRTLFSFKKAYKFSYILLYLFTLKII